MRHFENRMGWNDEIDSFARVFMSRMSKVVYEWATSIIQREGLILDRIDDQIKGKEASIAVKEAMLAQAEKEVAIFQEGARKAKKRWQHLIDEAGRCKTVANKYRLEAGNLTTLDEGSRPHVRQLARLRLFEPRYRQWISITREAEARLAEYQELTGKAQLADRKRKNLSLHGERIDRFSLFNERKFELRQLQKDKELLENAIARNMEKHRMELSMAFTDPRYITAVAGMIANTIDKSLNGSLRFDEFSENEIFQFLEEVFHNVSRDRLEKFNFLKVLAETGKYSTTILLGGKTVKVFDMDQIAVDDMMKIFSGWLRYSIGNATINVLEKMKRKRALFLPEQRGGCRDGDQINSLYDLELADNPGGFRIKDETIIRHHSAQEYWNGLESFLNRNLRIIADTVNEALQEQLPPNAYFRKVGRNGARPELHRILKEIIAACGGELRNGNVAFSKLRNFMKTALRGAEDGEIFNITYTIIRAALEYYVVSKMGRNILDEVKNLRREEAGREMALLRMLDRKRNMSEQALRDYRLVSFSSRTRRVPCVVREAEEFEDPEVMFRRLGESTRRLEKKINFQPDNISEPPGSARTPALAPAIPERR